MALHAYGDRGARIYCTPADGITVEYGAITYDEVRGRNFITWSEAAENQLERYKRDHWDSKFYAAMYRDAKGRS
jgi:hypothetical protein